MSEKEKVAKAAGIVGISTLLSRILGFVRDMVVAGFFGAGFFSDAFIAALRIPNLLRRLFAEGTLSMAFVPVFTDYLKNVSRDEAFRMARSVLRMLCLVLVLITIAGIILSPLIIKLVAYGFSEIPGKYELTVSLTRIMFPYLIFICLVALSMGILNVLGHFAAPALAPVMLNLAMIGAVFGVSFVSSDNTVRVIWLSIGVLIGGLLQLSLQLPFLVRKGFYFWKKAPFIHPGMVKIGKLMLPAVFGAGVYQVNMLIGTFLASLLPQGSVSYLYYADRLVQFPLGIFAVSIGTAVLPSLSRQAASNDFIGMKKTFAFSMKLIFFIILPSMAGLIILREPIVSMLFMRHAFTLEDARMTAYALLNYSFGLWAIAGVRIVVPTFYSLQDTKTPVKMAVISIVANIVLGIILMGPMAHAGLALATSIASIINLGMLIWALRKKLGKLGSMAIFASLVRSSICAAVMGFIVWALGKSYFPLYGDTWIGLFLGVAGGVGIGFSLYLLFSYVLKSSELNYLLKMIKREKCEPVD